MKILFRKGVRKDLRKINKHIADKIIEKIGRLEIKSSKKLIGTDYLRFRFGDYRIVYKITDDSLVVIRIRHRKDVYRNLI